MGTHQLTPAKRVGVYCLIVLVQIISAGYTVLTHDAIRSGNADALVFSLYRDACAFPILFMWAYLAEFLPESCRGKDNCCNRKRDARRRGHHSHAESFVSERQMDAEARKSAEALKRRSIFPRCADIPRFFGLGLFGMFGNQVRCWLLHDMLFCWNGGRVVAFLLLVRTSDYVCDDRILTIIKRARQ